MRLAIEIRRVSLVFPLIDGLQVMAARKALGPEAMAMRTLHVGRHHSQPPALAGSGKRAERPAPSRDLLGDKAYVHGCACGAAQQWLCVRRLT